MRHLPTRRAFLAGTASCAVAGHAGAQFAVGGTSQTTRLDLAVIDRARILAGAATALARSPQPNEDPLSEAFLQMTLDLPALAAATQIDPAQGASYSAKANETLKNWFGGRKLRLAISGFEDVQDFSALAEVAVSLPFLDADAEAMSGTKEWLRRYMAFLTTNVEAGLARDANNRVGTAWLLQVAAFARLLGDDKTTQELRVRYRHATLRAELNADGFFFHELRTPNPFRNSLMNLDQMAGVCVLLSTRFETMWDAELQDGPGMRSAVARHVPYLAKPVTWPYPADAQHFAELPGRRPVLAFAARAYSQPEYAALFLKLPELTDADLLRSLPIRQPLLWMVSPRRREA